MTQKEGMIRLEEPLSYGGYIITDLDTGKDIYVQVDYDFPDLAITFGWNGKLVSKAELRRVNIKPDDQTGAEIYSAIQWLDDHWGKEVEDPGYFVDITPRSGPSVSAPQPELEIIAVYDNGGETADRYTVYVNEYHGHDKTTYECLGLSDDCNMPNGFNEWSSGEIGPHNGKKIAFKDLPQKVQKCAKLRVWG